MFCAIFNFQTRSSANSREFDRIIPYFNAICKYRLKILRNYVFLPCSIYVIISSLTVDYSYSLN